MIYRLSVMLLGAAAIPVDLLTLAGGATAFVAIRRAATRSREMAQVQHDDAERQRAHQQEAARGQYLASKYGADAARYIVAGQLWQGATQDMVVEMFGRPLDVSNRVFKTKTKDVWKYRPLGGKRYGLAVTFENSVCVGWDQKDE